MWQPWSDPSNYLSQISSFERFFYISGEVNGDLPPFGTATSPQFMLYPHEFVPPPPLPTTTPSRPPPLGRISSPPPVDFVPPPPIIPFESLFLPPSPPPPVPHAMMSITHKPQPLDGAHHRTQKGLLKIHDLRFQQHCVVPSCVRRSLLFINTCLPRALNFIFLANFHFLCFQIPSHPITHRNLRQTNRDGTRDSMATLANSVGTFSNFLNNFPMNQTASDSSNVHIMSPYRDAKNAPIYSLWFSHHYTDNSKLRVFIT